MDSRTVILITGTHTSVAVFETRQREWHRSALMDFPEGFAHLPRDPSDLVPLGQHLGAWLQENIPGGAVCRLVIPSNWCFIQTLPCPLGKKRDQAAVFEFEQFLPTDLDALTCAVQPVDEERALVVGIETVPMLGFLNQLERHHILVEAIYVDSMIAHGSESPEDDDSHRAVMIRDANHCTLTVVRQGTDTPVFVRTVLLPDDGDPIDGTAAASIATTSPIPLQRLRLLHIGGEDGTAEAFAGGSTDTLDVHTRHRDDTVRSLLDAAANEESCADLRRDDLAFAGRWAVVGKRLHHVCLVLVALILALGIKYRVANWQLSGGIAALRPQRDAIYAQAYPGQVAPPEASLRIRSDRIKLEGLTEQGGSGGAMPATNGLELFERMHDIMEHVPPDLKLAIGEILLDERGIRIAGRTLSHGQAGELVQALNQLPSISAEPPHTKLRRDQTVDFRITARVGQENGHD